MEDCATRQLDKISVGGVRRRWRPLLWSLALTMTMPVTASADFHIRPHLQNVTRDGCTVIWESTDEKIGVVEFGPSAEVMTAVKEQVSARIHRVRLTGLLPGATYRYQVKEGAETVSASFKTAPEGPVPVTFVVVGDSRRWEDRWQATDMAKHTLQWKPDFFINNGDLVRSGHEYELWPEHFERFESINRELMMVSARGNHEGSMYWDPRRDWFARYHELPGSGEPVSTFDWGNTHFVIVSYEDAAQASEALERHLQGVTSRWTVVVQHFPVYCTGYDSPDDSRKELGETFASFAQVLDKYDVDLDLAGHTHIYERTYPIRGAKRDDRAGVTYVINGGDINANYPEAFTAVKDNTRRQAKPTYTVVRCLDDRIEMRTFCWSTAAHRVERMDYLTIWEDEAVPESALAAVEGKQGHALVAAIEEIGSMLYEPAVERLSTYLRHEDDAVRVAAAGALRHIGTVAASSALVSSLGDANVLVRREAARALEIALPPQLTETVKFHALDTEQDEEVREALLGALQWHGPEAIARQVALTLLDPQVTTAVRRRAAYLLGRIAQPADVRTLTRLVEKESDAYVLLRLADTLNRLTGKRVSLDAKGPLGISKPGRRRAFVETWLER